ncbi:methyltransferase domain-containing protein (plasmid) [Agrobacterium tumefaciens]|uniref:Methyltransferase domain-containing protein n=1 Tax=Agrobacterium tumefaciens TaxID=358 RepID=A0AAE6EIA6_AGRTU|nr:methyltransferase domain-containing protein [Agrobacterium tumefaciens]QCL82908.1 methyltransferase domain-containing protein [Agrobacterium tumefaciens]
MVKLAAGEVSAMSYNELIGVVRETNRPPGGAGTLREVAEKAFIGPTSRILDIGCSTGFTAVEFARLTGAETIGIDINATSVEVAKDRATRAAARTASFEVADAIALPFEDGTFDLVFCGNVTSLIDDQSKALTEYLRVLKPNGCLAAVPMYYLEPPPKEVVEKVRSAIQVPIAVKYRREATDFFRPSGLELVHESDWAFDKKTDQEIAAFCRKILGQVEHARFEEEALDVLKSLYASYMSLFRENLSYMGYTIMILRRDAGIDEGELFTGTRR